MKYDLLLLHFNYVTTITHIWENQSIDIFLTWLNRLVAFTMRGQQSCLRFDAQEQLVNS